jgi:hypothetical protein
MLDAYGDANSAYNIFKPVLEAAKTAFRAGDMSEAEFLKVKAEQKRLLAAIDEAEKNL